MKSNVSTKRMPAPARSAATPPRRARRRGAAALAILVSVMIMAAVVATSLVGISSSVAQSRGRFAREQALANAESGANRALWEIQYGDWSGWSTGDLQSRQITSDVKDGAGESVGSFTVTVSDPSQGNITVQSTGSRSTGYDASMIHRAVSVNIERSGGGGGWFQHGVYATNTVNVKTLAMIDSYDSSAGSYWATRGSDAKVAANSTMPGAVSVGGWSIIKGDAYVAPEGDPESGITGNVTGERGVLTSADQPPAVEAPTDISHDIGTVNLRNNEAITLTQDTVCDSVLMRNNAVINVQGDVRLYVRGGFKAKNNVRIKIPAGSSLTLYVGGDFRMQNAAVVNWTTRIPEQCIIYGLETCDEITIKNAALVYAAIYAPQAAFTGKNLAAVYGAVIVREVDIRNLAALHFDKAVRDLAPETLPQGGGGGGEDGPWNILNWQITR